MGAISQMPFLCLGILADLTFLGHFVRAGLTCFEGQRKVPQLEREGGRHGGLGSKCRAITLAVATLPCCDPGKPRPLARSPDPWLHRPGASGLRPTQIPPLSATSCIPAHRRCLSWPHFFPWNSKMQLLLSPPRTRSVFQSLFLSLAK